MIPFIVPYYSQEEIKVFRSKNNINIEDEILDICNELRTTNWMFTKSGEHAISLAIKHAKAKNNWDNPVIAIPSVCCGSVYRPAKQEGQVILVDVADDWNCILDEEAKKAHIIVFASLGGKRISLPEKFFKDQVFIDDAAQCFDYTCGLRPESDYGIFSFGKGKQMYADGGGILVKNISGFGDTIKYDLDVYNITKENFLSERQISLISSQLKKAEEIILLRARNANEYIDRLKSIHWIRLPSTKDNCFSKFTVFISQPNAKQPDKIPGRTNEVWRFIKHMFNNGIELEETYIPLHIRFPEDFPDKRYEKFYANHCWLEAISIPCRPNLLKEERQKIVSAIESFVPECTTEVNKLAYNHKYGHMEVPTSGFFKSLYESRLDVIRKYGKEKQCLDMGCGNGGHMMPLIMEGLDITGIDFSSSMLKKFEENCPINAKLFKADIKDMPFEDNSFDFIYSIATLYYVPNFEKAIEEVYRVLKPDGVAYLEFGNINSLNNFEAKRVSTGVVSTHINIDKLTDYLKELNFNVFKKEFFQIFPLYGSVVPKSIEPAMSQGHPYTFDQQISSSKLLQKYAFRHCIYLTKDLSKSKEHLEIEKQGNPKEWMSKENIEKRMNTIYKSLKDQLMDLVNMLIQDPTDALTVYMIAKLHIQSEEEQVFVNQMKKDIDRYIEKCS